MFDSWVIGIVPDCKPVNLITVIKDSSRVVLIDVITIFDNIDQTTMHENKSSRL